MPLANEDVWRILKYLPTDYAPYGENHDRDGAPTPDEISSASAAEHATTGLDAARGEYHGDCSSGCRWFAKLAGPLGYDWGSAAIPSRSVAP